ncbi:MAG: hypothetical protein AB8E15_13515, partial [Bdellovibrionales bacterium]
ISDDLEPNFGFTALGIYKVPRRTNYQDYAFVQYIKGCVFMSEKRPDGSVEYRDTAREFFGEYIKYRHESWQIDSLDSDPMYKNMLPKYFDQDGVKFPQRHGFYEWSKTRVPDKKIHQFLYQSKPKGKYTYVTDRSANAFFADGQAKNVSLSFKMCLHRTKDIPFSVSSPDLKIAKPLHCFTFSNSKIYNHDTNQFESISGIHNYCKGD